MACVRGAPGLHRSPGSGPAPRTLLMKTSKFPKWFKRRRYRHFDRPVNETFARKVMNPGVVSRHAFSPLIHYTKAERRYKKCPTTGERKIIPKERPIKYAAHRDACILSYYAYKITHELDARYRAIGISDNVIAYRALGKANYEFAAEAI